MATMPTANRSICGSAHMCGRPPDTEYSIRNPAEATAASRNTKGQFRCRILRQPVGVCATL